MKILLAINAITLPLICMAIIYIFISNEPLRYHNDLLNDIGNQAVELSVSSVGIYDSSNIVGRDILDGIIKSQELSIRKIVKVTDRAIIKEICNCLILDELNENDVEFHQCTGNIKITANLNNRIHEIKYDHASGIYPLYESKSYGFKDIKKQQCDKLYTILLQLGFDKDETV
jgi:hypothetical protein